jgi:aryl-alcohol dehydrogenase-like predicted oxidoreductase
VGINFFDTADMYSRGVSEEITGRAIREYARPEEVVVASKVYFKMGDGPHMSGLSRKHIVQACEASLKRLGLDASYGLLVRGHHQDGTRGRFRPPGAR